MRNTIRMTRGGEKGGRVVRRTEIICTVVVVNGRKVVVDGGIDRRHHYSYLQGTPDMRKKTMPREREGAETGCGEEGREKDGGHQHTEEREEAGARRWAKSLAAQRGDAAPSPTYCASPLSPQNAWSVGARSKWQIYPVRPRLVETSTWMHLDHPTTRHPMTRGQAGKDAASEKQIPFSYGLCLASPEAQPGLRYA
jgi:hypothetical protein